MSTTRSDSFLTNDERTYLVVRTVVVVVGIGFYIFGYLPTQQPSERTLMAWGLILSAVPTVLMFLSVARRAWPVSTMMLWVAPADFASYTILSSLTTVLDPMFPIAVIFATLFAMTLRRRQANLLSIGVAASYFYGNLLSRPNMPLAMALTSFKALLIVVISILVSSAVERRRARERDVERAIAERELANEQLERRVHELQAVSQITEAIHSSLDLDEVGVLVLDIMSKVLHIDALCVFVLDEEKNETLFSASVGVPREGGTTEAGPALADIESHFTCLRVFSHDGSTVLFCAPGDDVERLTEDDRLVIHTVASELVVAVENSRLYKLTRRLAVTDELTGMHNYRFFQARLDEEIGRAIRYEKHVSLLMLDADDFKGFNDRYGHIAGDRALAEFGGVLAGLVRGVDVLARYGGEEFAVLLPETDAAGAYVVAEKIREAFSAHVFADAEGTRCCNLTVSIGVATYPDHADDKEALLREADDALYRAKNGGRDRVCAPARMLDTETTSWRET